MRAATQVCLCTFQLTDISLLDKHLNANGARKEILTNKKRRFLVRLEAPKSFRFDQRKPQRPVYCTKIVRMTCNSCVSTI